MVELTARLAEVESPSDDPSAVAAAGDLFASELEATGYRVRRLTGRGGSAGHLVAVPRERTRPGTWQLLVGHLDTVWPVGTLETMPVRLGDGRFEGPGVFDMKGGLVQGLFAVRALRALEVPVEVAPVFFVNGDEEVGSPDSIRLLPRLARGARRALVLEPAMGPGGALKTARKGVGRYQFRFTGRSAHAGLDPEAGRSAIVALARTVERLHAMSDPDRGVTLNPGVVSGGTRANVVAARAELLVDLRVRTLADAEAVEGAIRALPSGLEGVTVTVEGGLATPPLERTPRNRRLWEAALEVGRRLGIELDEVEAGGGSDGNHTSLLTATLDGLGAVGDGAHAVHEHLRIDAMPERAALVAGLIGLPAGAP
jgi:glutamate carboxypeptidase